MSELKFLPIVALLLFSLFGSPADAGEAVAGSLKIGPVWARATPPGASTAAGYLTVANEGAADDRLLAIEFSAATGAMLHETTVTDDVSSMRMLGNLPVPAGSTVTLKPGALHVMFTGLSGALKKGDQIPGTLVFEKAGRVSVVFDVAPIGADNPMPSD